MSLAVVERDFAPRLSPIALVPPKPARQLHVISWATDCAPRLAPVLRVVRPSSPPPRRLRPISWMDHFGVSNFAPRVRPASQDLIKDWRPLAACRGMGNTPEGIEIFFPNPGGSQKLAKRICGGCRVDRECGAFAESIGEEWGIWNGRIRTR